MATPSPEQSEWSNDTRCPYGYACLTEKGLFRLDELSEEDLEHAVRVIVGYCSSSRSPFIHVVPSKATSNDKFAAERIVDDIVYLGHTSYPSQ